jgi:membrane protein implicated in regulation of membrane protease activity
MTVRKGLRDNSLSWFFGLLLVGALVGQAFTGLAFYNANAAVDDLPTLTIGEYVTSSQFAVDVAENWQSEYLQFLLYILLTVWLIQRGSPESKKPEERGGEDDKKQKVGRNVEAGSPRWAKAGGWRTALYSNSLGIVMGLFFLGSWSAQLVAGTSAYNSDRLQNLQAPVSMGQYAVSADFWNRTFQNWQSEFLAVGSMVVLSIYLRQRGSPESKPVGSAHTATGVEG